LQFVSNPCCEQKLCKNEKKKKDKWGIYSSKEAWYGIKTKRKQGTSYVTFNKQSSINLSKHCSEGSILLYPAKEEKSLKNELL